MIILGKCSAFNSLSAVWMQIRPNKIHNATFHQGLYCFAWTKNNCQRMKCCIFILITPFVCMGESFQDYS